MLNKALSNGSKWLPLVLIPPPCTSSLVLPALPRGWAEGALWVLNRCLAGARASSLLYSGDFVLQPSQCKLVQRRRLRYPASHQCGAPPRLFSRVKSFDRETFISTTPLQQVSSQYTPPCHAAPLGPPVQLIPLSCALPLFSDIPTVTRTRPGPAAPLHAAPPFTLLSQTPRCAACPTPVVHYPSPPRTDSKSGGRQRLQAV